MPYKLCLTWAAHAKRWRKRFQGKTYYLKTRSNGRKDRTGYLIALQEWERLKAFIDGLGPNPYTLTGALIPEPPQPTAAPMQPVQFQSAQSGESTEYREAVTDLPPWILSTGIFPFLKPDQEGNPYAGERRISEIADFWLDHRKSMTERGELSLKQWGEEKTKLKVFRDFVSANYPTTIFVDQITPQILNHYRDKQRQFVGTDADDAISKITLKKRLSVLVSWLNYLVDQNILPALPKDLRKYARVKIDKPEIQFFSPDEIKALAAKATQRTKLYIMLGLNCAFTQKDIATLTPEMIDWDTGIITRNRSKTSVPTIHKLWPSTLKLLKIHRNRGRGPVLVNKNGNPLLVESINKQGTVARRDAISLAFKQLGDSRGFKYLRKSSANLIEAGSRPDLVSLFLGHSEKHTTRFNVSQHFGDELFSEILKLEKTFGFDKP
jgi:integrase